MSNNTASSPTMEVDGMNTITVFGDRWEAKQKIERLFKERKELDYLDVTEILGLNLKLVIDLCKELELEGKIEDASKGENNVR